MSFVGFLILVLLVLLGIWIFVKLAALPGKTAKARNHPQSDAINVLGWVGIITLGLAWPVALVWAYPRSGDEALRERIEALEAEPAELKSEGGDA